MTFAPLSKLFIVLFVAIAASSSGCSRFTSSDDPDRRKSVQLDQAPAIPTKLNIAFGDKLVLLGYKLEAPEHLNPKDKAKITFYWRIDKELDTGFRLSTRVLSEQGDLLYNADDSGPLRERRRRKQIIPPSSWVKGKIYVDEVTLRMPSKLAGQFVKVAMAVRKSEQSLMPNSGDGDKDGYTTVAKMPIDQRRKARPVPQLLVPMLESSSKLTIDGNPTEPAWRNAATLPILVDMDNGHPTYSSSRFSGSTKLLWNEEALYLAVQVHDQDLSGGFKKSAKEPPVWKRDGFELVMKLDETRDNSNYYRIAVGLQGLIFDSAYDDFELPVSDKAEPLGHLEWSSNVQSAIVLSGTMDDASDVDEGYAMEVSIPWSAFAKDKEFVPRAGSALWANFAIHSQGKSLGFVPYYTDQSLQVARRFGKLVLSPAGTPASEPTEIEPLMQELPERLTKAQAAEAATLAAEAAASNVRKGGASAASANPGAEVATPPPAPAK